MCGRLIKTGFLNDQNLDKPQEIAAPASPGEETRDKPKRKQLTYAGVGVDDQLLRLPGHGAPPTSEIDSGDSRDRADCLELVRKFNARSFVRSLSKELKVASRS